MEEPTEMENELEERLKTAKRRIEVALILLHLNREDFGKDLLPTILEDIGYGIQIIIDKFCVKESK